MNITAHTMWAAKQSMLQMFSKLDSSYENSLPLMTHDIPEHAAHHFRYHSADAHTHTPFYWMDDERRNRLINYSPKNIHIQLVATQWGRYKFYFFRIKWAALCAM